MTTIALSLKTSTPTNWQDPLFAYFKKIYGDSEDFGEEIAALDKLRQNVLGAGKNIVGRDILYQYYAQLEQLSPRIPINERGCHVKFTWRALHSDETFTQQSIAFEKAAVLFNLGAVMSNIAEQDEKSAYHAYQAAAGCFHTINVKFLHAPSVDLDHETTKVLTTLMLAQAELAFYNRASSNAAMKPLILAKLARGAALKFQECSAGLERLYKEDQWGKSSWGSLTKNHGKLLDGIAHQKYALALESKAKHGLAIAHTQAAIKLLGEVEAPLKQSASSLKEVVANELKTLIRDNDLIYNEDIPPITEEIPGKDSAAPLPLEQFYNSEELARKVIGEPLFQRVIPIEIHEKASLYSEEKAQLLRDQRDLVEIAEEELSSALEYMDLPRSASILLSSEDDKDLVSVPVMILDWASEIASKRIKVDFRTEQDQIMALAQTAFVSTHPTSAQRLQDIKLSIVKSRSKDEEMKVALKDVEPELALLRAGPTGPLVQEFAKLAPSQSAAAAPAIENLLELDSPDKLEDGKLDIDCEQTIKGILESVKRLRENNVERKRILSILRDQLQKDDIRPLLVNNRGERPYSEVSAEALLKFRAHTSRLEMSVKKQKSLVETISEDWAAVLAMPCVRKMVKAREQSHLSREALVERLRKAYQVWCEVKEQSQNAILFYQQLREQVQSPMNGLEQSFRNLSTHSKPPPPPKRPLY